VRASVVAVAGAIAIFVGALEFDIPVSHTLQIVGLAAAASFVTTGIGAIVLYALRRRSLGSQVNVLVASTIAGAGFGSWAVARAMFLSNHDFSVLVVVLVTAGVWASLGALLLGHRVSKSAMQLVEATKQLNPSEQMHTISGSHSSEMARMAHELTETSARLHQEQQRSESLERSRRELISWMTADVDLLIGQIETTVKSDEERSRELLLASLSQLRRVGNDLVELHNAE
jgi:hypothetical protein